MPILRATSSASASVRPVGRVDEHLVDLLGRLRGDFLDVHAALGARHQHDALRAAVDDHADVELLLDVGALLDQQPAHLLPAGAGLVRDELHAEDLAGALLHLVERVRELDAAALAAAARVDLRLDHPHRRRRATSPARTASSTVNAGMPRGVGMPYLRKISLPWYSWIFTRAPALGACAPRYHFG